MKVNNVVNLPENYFSAEILSLPIPVHPHVCSLQVTHQCSCAVLLLRFLASHTLPLSLKCYYTSPLWFYQTKDLIKYQQ